MSQWRRLKRRIQTLLRKKRVEAELDEEVRLHLTLEAEDLVRQGWDPKAAHREAHLRLGGVEPTKELCRQNRPLSWLEELARDSVYALRTLRHRPGFALAVVLSLALGIGGNTAIFTLLDAVLWRTLPVERPEELWVVGDWYRYQEFRTFAEEEEVLSGIAAYGQAAMNVSIDGSLEPTVEGQLVSGDYFSLLGVSPMAGRAIGPEDDQVPNGHPVAMLSHGYWSRRFGRDPKVISSILSISGTPFTIIGVTPPEFSGVEVGSAPDLYVPLLMQPTLMPTYENLLENPIILRNWLRVLARLPPGTSPQQATVALDARLRAAYPTLSKGTDPEARRERILEALYPALEPATTGLSALRLRFSQPLFILMGIVGILLLIACANTANLLLARASARRREFAMRRALGARRLRLIQQLLVESLFLAGLGGLAGLIVAHWMTRLLVGFLSRGRSPVVLDLNPDLDVLLFTASISIVTGILFGLAPAIRATGVDAMAALRSATGLAAGRRGLTTDRLLTVLQMGLSLTLLIGAGLFVRSLAALNDRDADFDRQSVLVARIEPRGSDQRNIEGTSARLDRLYRDLIARIEALPAVRSASLAQFTPTNRVGLRLSVTDASGERIETHVPMVYPGYFETMGIPFSAGRDFEPDELDVNVRTAAGRQQETVAIVNETLARALWPGVSPLGRSCDGADGGGASPPCRIVGVVEDSAYADFRGDIVATRYQPFLQTRTGRGQMALHVRTTGDAQSMIPLIRREVARVDATVPLFEVQTLAEEVDAVLVRERLIAVLVSVFAGLALLLASVGLYGLLAFTIVRRTPEIGLRIALGAARTDVVWMVMREAAGLLVVGGTLGLVLGLAAVLIAGSQLSGLLYELDALDLPSFGVAFLVLSLVALLAAYLPARRASRVTPTIALRVE